MRRWGTFKPSSFYPLKFGSNMMSNADSIFIFDGWKSFWEWFWLFAELTFSFSSCENSYSKKTENKSF